MPDREKFEQNMGINPMNMGMAMFSPNKMLVESSTMIFIITFMIFNIVTLAYKGPTMSPTQSMLGLVGLFMTFILATRQYASFR